MLYEKGQNFRQIAERFEIAPMTAKRAVLLAGGKVPDSPDTRMRARGLTRISGPPRRKRAYVDSSGYRHVLVLLDDPMYIMGRSAPRRISRIVLEHRLVLARKIGRPLKPHETVHHRNGDTSDNRPSNLELRIGRHGKGATTKHCATCRCFRGVKRAS